MSDTRAQAQYHDRRTKVEQKLQRIDRLIEVHRATAGDSLNWGDVGELAYVNQQLGEIVGFLARGEK